MTGRTVAATRICKLLTGAVFLVSVTPSALRAKGIIEGQVSNGTTHRPVPGQTVRLLMPRGGMQQVGSVWTDASGRFAFTGSPPDPKSFYLVSTVFQGVPYNEAVQFGPDGKATVNISVFDATHSDAGLRISQVRTLVAAEGDVAHVQAQYAVENAGNPPRAYSNAAGTFSFRVPPEAGEPNVTVTGLMNMPLPQTPEKGSAPGEFKIQYPLKPGVTIVTVQYETGYTASGTDFQDQVSYPVTHAELYAFPETLTVNSPVFKPAGIDSEHHVAKFVADDLPRGAELEARLAGEPAAASTDKGQQQVDVKMLPNAMTRLDLPVLACFLILLLWALGVRVSKEWSRWKARSPASPAQKKFSARIEGLLNSLADLDELYAARKITEEKYWKERLELKAKLVAILKKHPPALLESYAARHIPH